MRRLGLVLAGGRSTRFGAEKAIADFNGRPMIAWVAEALLAGCEAVAVNAPEGSGAATWARENGRALLPDPPSAADGPLTGVLEGLRWAVAQGADALVTAPCDTPGLPPDFASRALAVLAERSCAYAVSPDGPHPPCAAWRIDRLAALEAALTEGRHPSVWRLLDSWGAAHVVFADARPFTNFNTPASFGAPYSVPADEAGGDSR